MVELLCRNCTGNKYINCHPHNHNHCVLLHPQPGSAPRVALAQVQHQHLLNFVNSNGPISPGCPGPSGRIPSLQHVKNLQMASKNELKSESGKLQSPPSKLPIKKKSAPLSTCKGTEFLMEIFTLYIQLKFISAQSSIVAEIYESSKAIRSCFEAWLIFMSIKVLSKVGIADALHI